MDNPIVIVIILAVLLAVFGAFIFIVKNNKKTKETTKKTAQEFIGIKEIGQYGVLMNNGQLILFFKITPVNITVLPPSTIESKIYSLTNVLKNIGEFEITCLNSAESFEGNKDYLKERIEKENNPVVHKLLAQDLKFLDDIQLEMSTAREFLFSAKYKADRMEQVISEMQRIEKVLKEQGFEAKRATKKELKRILAVYFAQNVVSEYFDDFDGERWIENDEA